MMAAKPKEAHSAEIAERGPSAPAGFGKVLHSIQGLQQRLEDFSIDEVSRAEAKAETLIQQLSSIRYKLAGLPLIKNALEDAQRRIGALPEENSELAALSPLGKYAGLNALLTTAVRLHEAVRACPEKLPAVKLQAQPMPPKEAHISPAAPAAPVIEAPEWVLGDIAPLDTRGGSGEAVHDPDTILAAAHEASPPEFSFGAPHGSASPAQASSVETGAPAAQRKESQFDLRLLNEVIKHYGEFASFSGAPAPRKASEPPPIAVPPAAPTAEDEPPPLAAKEIRPGGEPAVIMPETAVEAAAACEEQTAEAEIETGTSLTRRSDIDRHIKSIIKDYGEYDLYSHRSSLNTKVAGIIAFALLGLVMVAFYVFKTPAGVAGHPARPAAPSEIAPASAGASASGTKTTENPQR
jgi:hypothetical protein